MANTCWVAIDGDGEEKIANCELVGIFDIFKGKKLIKMQVEEWEPLLTWVPKYCSKDNEVFTLPTGSIKKLIGREWIPDDGAVKVEPDE